MNQAAAHGEFEKCAACGEVGALRRARNAYPIEPYGPPKAALPEGAFCPSCLDNLVDRLYAEHPETIPTRCYRCRIEFGVGGPGLPAPLRRGLFQCPECKVDTTIVVRPPIVSRFPIQVSGGNPGSQQSGMRERAFRQRVLLSDLRDRQEVLASQLRAAQLGGTVGARARASGSARDLREPSLPAAVQRTRGGKRSAVPAEAREEVVRRAQKLKARGMTWAQIGPRFGVSASTIYRWDKQMRTGHKR